MILGSELIHAHVRRSGVIPYLVRATPSDFVRSDARASAPTTTASDVYLLVARDTKTGEICDLGGGVKNGETVLQAGLREFEEESNGAFGNVYADTALAEASRALLDDTMALLFFPLTPEWYAAAAKVFDERRLLATEKVQQEVDKLQWVDLDEFFRLISGTARIGEGPTATGGHLAARNAMWTKLSRFLTRNIGSHDEFVQVLTNAYPFHPP